MRSRTRAYPCLRIAGALFAAIASIGGIAERLFDLRSSVDIAVNTIAHHAVWIAGALFLLSLACWFAAALIESETTQAAPAKAMQMALPAQLK